MLVIFLRWECPRYLYFYAFPQLFIRSHHHPPYFSLPFTSHYHYYSIGHVRNPYPSAANTAGADDDDDNDAGTAASSDVDAADDNAFDNANNGVFDNKAAVNVVDNNAMGDDANSNAVAGNTHTTPLKKLPPLSLPSTLPASPPTVVTVMKKWPTVPSCLVLRLIIVFAQNYKESTARALKERTLALPKLMIMPGHQKVTTECLLNLQSLSYLRYPETPVSLHSPQGETDVQSPRGYDVAGVGGGWIHLAVGTASEGSPPLLEVKFTHTQWSCPQCLPQTAGSAVMIIIALIVQAFCRQCMRLFLSWVVLIMILMQSLKTIITRFIFPFLALLLCTYKSCRHLRKWLGIRISLHYLRYWSLLWYHQNAITFWWKSILRIQCTVLWRKRHAVACALFVYHEYTATGHIHRDQLQNRLIMFFTYNAQLQRILFNISSNKSYISFAKTMCLISSCVR